jgi:conjugal transfer pilus assembly protein TraE
MKLSKFFLKYDEVTRENGLLKFCILLLAVGFIVSSFFSYKAINNQKIIIMTPNLEDDLRLETQGNSLNFNFIKIYSEYIASLLLNYTPGSYERKINDFLFLCTPEYESFARKSLYKNLENIKKTGASSLYTLTEKIRNDEDKKKIYIYGKRVLMISGKIVESSQENYVIDYNIINRRFFVNGFSKSKE